MGEGGLPELRAELELMKGAPQIDGAPSWLIFDPVANRFIQIDEAAFLTLGHWRRSASAEDLVRRVNADGRVAIDKDAVSRLVEFLHRTQLTAAAPRDGWRYFAGSAAKGRQSPGAWLLHHYLFFKLPLFRPQRFLVRTLPVARLLSSRAMLATYASLGLVGLYLVSREWDRYLATLVAYSTWDGAALVGAAIMVVKALHELGHAYVAVHHGCRVPTMGLAVMLMAPLPYTDVTDAWRLTDRRKRRAIDSAGIKVEVAVAAVALFLWAFLPDGPLKSAMFVLSAVGLVSTLALNLNPLMKFDGYYLLAELVGLENLQPRSFEFGRWKLREWLFGLGLPPPEPMPRRVAAFMIGYAWAVWIYRLVLFIGIALVVYHYFFKLLGVFLFVVEIVFFIARPAWSELKVWWLMRRDILSKRRVAISGGVALLAIAAAFVPWSTRVEIPAVLEAARSEPVHARRAARVELVHVTHGADVEAGAPLVTLASPDIDNDIEVTKTRLRLARLQHSRRGASSDDREASLVLESTIAALVSRLEGLQNEKRELVIRSPFAGRITEFDPELHVGRWVSPRRALAVLSSPASLVARGYVSETDLLRLETGDRGRFVPDHAQRASRSVSVTDISVASSAAIEITALSSTHGGRVTVVTDERQRDVPQTAQYTVRLSVDDADAAAAELAIRGVAVLAGRPESPAARFWRHVLKILVRESGA